MHNRESASTADNIQDFRDVVRRYYDEGLRYYYEARRYYDEDFDKSRSYFFSAQEHLLFALDYFGKIPVCAQNEMDIFYLFNIHLGMATINLDAFSNVLMANIHYEKALEYYNLLPDKSLFSQFKSISDLLAEIKNAYSLTETYCKGRYLEIILDFESDNENESRLTEIEKNLIKDLEPDFNFEEDRVPLQKGHHSLSKETFKAFSLFAKNRVSEIEKELLHEKQKASDVSPPSKNNYCP